MVLGRQLTDKTLWCWGGDYVGQLGDGGSTESQPILQKVGADSCATPVCGDGQRDWGEECDDGNTVSGDVMGSVELCEVPMSSNPQFRRPPFPTPHNSTLPITSLMRSCA